MSSSVISKNVSKIKSRKIKTNTVALKELRTHMEKYIKLVSKGESFTIFRRSQPIFKIAPVDQYGDEGEWETIVDFTKIRKSGVPIDDVYRALKKLNGQD